MKVTRDCSALTTHSMRQLSQHIKRGGVKPLYTRDTHASHVIAPLFHWSEKEKTSIKVRFVTNGSCCIETNKSINQ